MPNPGDEWLAGEVTPEPHSDDRLTPETWTPKQMGSEGWAVFRPHPRRPSLDVMLCTGLTEEDARLIASAPALQRRVETAERMAHDAYWAGHKDGNAAAQRTLARSPEEGI